MNMKRIGIIVSVLLAVASATTVFAAPWKGCRGSGGWGADGAYQKLYDPATVETVNGEVTAVEKFTSGKGMGAGIHLQLKTDKGTIPVHLGPLWYIERLDARIEQGDVIEVKGSRVTYGGKPAIIAAEVKRGSEVLMLRDSGGIPVWAGWRRSGQ